jgi:hypothetical protein
MCFFDKRVSNCLYRCHSMLFVPVRSQVTCVVTHERVCNCLYRCHSMLFVLVRSQVTCVITHERVCNCLYRCHSMLFVQKSTNNIELLLYRQ